MIDQQKVTEAVRSMTRNPDWGDVLWHAPGLAKWRVALAFYANKFLEGMDQPQKDEYREFREYLDSRLNASELKYLVESFARMGTDKASDHYMELLSRKSPEEQSQGQKEYDALMDDLRKRLKAEEKDGEAAPDAPEGALADSGKVEADEEPPAAGSAPEAPDEPSGDDAGEGEPKEGAQDSAPGVFTPALDEIFEGYCSTVAEDSAPGTSADADAEPVQDQSAPFTVPAALVEKNKARAREVVKKNVGVLKNGFRFKKRAAASPAEKTETTDKE